jgi:Spy/CpxP family protein refolding chaperone
MQVRGKFWMGAIVVATLCVCLAAAQDSPPQSAPPSGAPPEHPAPGARRTMEGFGELRYLSQQLNLTEEQKEKLRPILMEEGEKLRTTRLDEHLPLDQKRAKLLEIRDSYRPKIAELLTPEQQEKLKKMQEAEQQRRQQQMKGAETGSPAQKPQ